MPLLEREAELAVLDECVASAAAGEGRLVVISGEAGVGKTALVKELCARRRSVARELWGQCDPLQTPRALGPVLDIARAAGGSLAKLADSDDRHHLFTEFLAACCGGRSADARRPRRHAVGRCRHPRLPRVRRTSGRPHPVRPDRDAPRRPSARPSLARGLGRARHRERAAAASARSVERQRSRDARGVDAVGSGGGPSAERRRSVRRDRAACSGPGGPDVSARHGARACRAAEPGGPRAPRRRRSLA